MERGDAVRLTVGTRTFTYTITGDEGGVSPTSPDFVLRAIEQAVQASGLFAESVRFEMSEDSPSRLLILPIRDNVGQIAFDTIERTNINDQTINVNLSQEPMPALPERVEFFQSLQEVSVFLRTGSQDQIQGKLDHLDQMLTSITLSLADIGAEMNSIDDEISINENVKLQLQSALSGQEDLDYASAITELQAKMMSLEAAQSSFAKISQLSIFDYIR